MQISIDILAETPQALRLAAHFLTEHAALREAMEGALQSVPQGTEPHTTAQVPPPPPPPPAVVHPEAAPDFIPPPLTMVADTATAQDTSTANPISAPASVGQHEMVDAYDKSGVPFDERIHQKSRKTKQDGTWKLKKGLDATIVAAVMKELTPRIRGANSTPVSAGASPAPVSLPIVPPPPAPAPSQENVAPPPPPPSVPAAPQEGEQARIDPYRALVAKIVEARRQNKITQEEVTQCVTSAGVPSLQLLNNMPHLVDTVETNIDAILATR